MRGFEPYREAVRSGIRAAGREPVMAEDWPSLGDSSRTACLDLVASSDAFVLIVGERGGWAAPSGMLVVEEEWEEARRRKLPVRVFIQEGVERDAGAERLAVAASDYVAGHFRRTFTDPASLAAEVERAVVSIEPLHAHSMTPNADSLRALALAVGSDRQERRSGDKTLRFVLAPERPGEVIDPRKLDDPDFHHAVMTAAQSPSHRIVQYGQPVVPRVQGTALVLQQTGNQQNWREPHAPRVEVHEHGLIVIDTTVDTPDPSGMGSIPPHVLDEARVEAAFTASFRFAGAIYALVDPYARYERFLMDSSLAGVQGNVLERDPQPRSSYSIPHEWMFGGQGASPPVTPLQAPRMVIRRDLEHPEEEVSRAMVYLRRTLAAPSS